MSFGAGVLKGLIVTFKNMWTSYSTPRFQDGGVTTLLYPEEKPDLRENFRQFPFLIYDGTEPMGDIRCTACKICEQECPPQCIFIIQEKDEKGKPVQRPKVFDIDMSICMSCQICAEVCPFEAIRMDHDFELSEYGRFEQLYYRMDKLLKPNSYYHSIKPTDATLDDAAVKAREEKKRAAEEKRKAVAAAKAAEAKAAAEAKPAAAPEAKPAPAGDESVPVKRPSPPTQPTPEPSTGGAS